MGVTSVLNTAMVSLKNRGKGCRSEPLSHRDLGNLPVRPPRSSPTASRSRFGLASLKRNWLKAEVSSSCGTGDKHLSYRSQKCLVSGEAGTLKQVKTCRQVARRSLQFCLSCIAAPTVANLPISFGALPAVEDFDTLMRAQGADVIRMDIEQP